MKNKKMLLPVVILAAALLAMIVCSLFTAIAKKPTVTEKEFAFTITYELDGERVTINDVYTAYYDGNGGYADSKSRIYHGKIGGMEGIDDTYYTLKQKGNERIELDTNFYPDYMMGDPDGDYFSEVPFEPVLLYYDAEENEYCDAETLQSHGAKLISWEYPEPIENSFEFSHISIFSGEVVMPTLFISILALVACIIFVKKDPDFVIKPIDRVSTTFNYLVGFITVPFMAFSMMLSDITGDNEDIIHQILYFAGAITVLCIALSICLRRKNYSVSALVTTFIGPALFATLLFVWEVSSYF